MLKVFKAIHIVGLAMFLGSIFAHIAAGQAPGAMSDPQAMLFARQTIDLTTRYVTMPGLAITIVSGIIMAAGSFNGFLKRRWLALHLMAALIIAALALAVIIPAGREALAAAGALAAGAGSREAFTAPAGREHLFGAVNIVLALAAIALGAGKPRLRQRQQ